MNTPVDTTPHSAPAEEVPANISVVSDEHEKTEITAETTHPTPDAPSLGERLRAARLAQDLSEESVAASLKWSLKYVRAMEESRFEALPPGAFVRGFVRDYARLLSLSVDNELQELFPTKEGTSNLSLVKPMSASRSGGFPSGSYTRKKMLWRSGRAVLVLALGALLIYGLLLAYNAYGTKIMAEAPTINGVKPSSAPAKSDNGAPHTNTMKPIALSVSALPSDNLLASPSASSNPSSSLTSTTVAASSPSSVPQTTTSAHQLILVTTAQSWVQIQNMDESERDTVLLRQGETFSRQVSPPFRLVVGNAQSVRASFNGEAISLFESLTENGNARLIVR